MKNKNRFLFILEIVIGILNYKELVKVHERRRKIPG